MTPEVTGALIALGGVTLGGLVTFVDSALRGKRDHRLASLDVRRTTYAETLSLARDANRGFVRLANPGRWPGEDSTVTWRLLKDISEHVGLLEVTAPTPVRQAATNLDQILWGTWHRRTAGEPYDSSAFEAEYDRLVDLCREDLRI